jgi:hypothetical protein
MGYQITINFDALDERCGICGKARGNHKSGTLNCPIGGRSRIGHTSYHRSDVFIPKVKKEKKNGKNG